MPDMSSAYIPKVGLKLFAMERQKKVVTIDNKPAK
jgi:hypothetical protein